MSYFSTGANLGGATTSNGYTGEIGGSSLNLKNNGSTAVMAWPGNGNWITTANGFSILWRGTIEATGTFLTLFNIGLWGQGFMGNIQLNWSNGSPGTLNLSMHDYAGHTIVNNVASTSGMVTGTIYDIVLTWDHSTSANAIKLYVNGSTINTFTSGQTISSIPNPPMHVMLGGCGLGSNSYINEFFLWSGVINPSSVLLTSGNGALNGNSRTAFVDVSSFDGSVNTGAGAANIRSGTTETIAGVVVTGTAAIPTAANVRSGTATDATTGTLAVPAAGNVRSGVSVDNTTGTLVVPSLANTKTGVAGDGGTGTYDGSDRWTNPGPTNVRSGTAYKANSTSNNQTGSAAIPTAANVRSGISVDAGTGTLVVPSLANTKTGVAGDGGTGTYDGSDRWSDPGPSNVKSGVSYKANSVTDNETGTYAPACDYPSELDVREGVDFNDGNSTGSLDLADGGDIRAGVTQDNGNIVGSLDVLTDPIDLAVNDHDDITIELGEP